MSAIEIKEYLHRQIDGLDERFLNVVYAMINTYIDEGQKIIGYDSNGKPITKNNLAVQVMEAENRINSGQFITQEDLEKEAENW